MILLPLFMMLFILFGIEETWSLKIHDNYNLQLTAQTDNIIQYHSYTMQYVIQNYAKLHTTQIAADKTVTYVTLLNQVGNEYYRKQLLPFFDYHNVTFNYYATNNSANLYLVIGFNKSIVAHHSLNLTAIMANVAHILDRQVYQSNNLYWEVPLVVKQTNCQIAEIYSITNDNNNIRQWFSDWCNTLDKNQHIYLDNYLIITPILHQ
jgi:hypothetical protein